MSQVAQACTACTTNDFEAAEPNADSLYAAITSTPSFDSVHISSVECGAAASDPELYTPHGTKRPAIERLLSRSAP